MGKIYNRFKNDFVLLTFGTILGAFIKFFYSVFSKRMVDPADYGVFTAVSIILTYMNYVQLGTLNAYNRDYPQLKGANNLIEAKRVKDATLTYVLSVYGVIVLVAEAVVLVRALITGDQAKNTVGYMLIFANSLFVALNSFATFSTKMEGKFNLAAIGYIFQTAGAVALGLLLIHMYGYVGLYAEGLISSVLGCLFFYRYWAKDYKPNFDVLLIKKLLLSGIPLLINNLIWTVVGSIDKFVILGFMDTTTLGYYSIATMAFTTMVLVPQTMSNVFYIKVNQEYGKDNDKIKLVKHSQQYTLLSSVCTGAICLLAYNILPIFVSYIMPNYQHGVKAAQIIITGIAIYSSTLLYGNLFTILREHKALLINSISLCVFNIILSVSLVLVFEKDIKYVAYGTSISYALYSLLLVYRLRRITQLTWKSFFYFSWLPVITAIIPCICFDYMIIPDFMKLFFSTGLYLIVMAICYGGVAIRFLKGRE